MSEHSKKPHEEQPVIIIKKVIKKAGHHGGSWKIAYADFVTAMMAFFLLMWLLSMLNKYQLMGISNYFNKPLKNVFVQNQKNDSKTKKIPDEQTKKYKLQLISQEKVPIDAQSRGNQSKNDAKSKGTSNNKPTFEELKEKLENDLAADPELKKYAQQLNFTVVKDGLKINLHDLENKPMFSSGEPDFEEYAKPILKWLTAKINGSHRKLTIIGHTDTNQYANTTDYSNWELSTDRANTTRRVLIKYGMDPVNVLRIQGAADSVPLDKIDGEDPINRRIEIILLSDKAVKRLLQE